METYKCINKSYSYKGKITLSDALNIKSSKAKAKLHIVDFIIQRQMIYSQVMKKYEKLLKLISFYLDSDDETGVAYQEVLNEIERFRMIIVHKYRKFLTEKKQEEIEEALKLYATKARQKLFVIDRQMTKPAKSTTRGGK